MNSCSCNDTSKWSLIVVEAFDIWEITKVICTNCNEELITNKENEIT